MIGIADETLGFLGTASSVLGVAAGAKSLIGGGGRDTKERWTAEDWYTQERGLASETVKQLAAELKRRVPGHRVGWENAGSIEAAAALIKNEYRPWWVQRVAEHKAMEWHQQPQTQTEFAELANFVTAVFENELAEAAAFYRGEAPGAPGLAWLLPGLTVTEDEETETRPPAPAIAPKGEERKAATAAPKGKAAPWLLGVGAAAVALYFVWGK